jgi:hypothetical protein
MTGTQENNSLWRRTTILVRADLLGKAREQKIDIDHACNKALADLLKIDLSQQPLESHEGPLPVMVAPDTVPVKMTGPAEKSPASLHPVVNANDPAAVRTMLKVKKERPAPPSKEPGPVPALVKSEAMQARPEGRPRTGVDPVKAKPKTKVPASGKRGKEDIIKQFITETILRGEPDEAAISKDEMFDHFSRWCRSQRITPVPDKRRFTTTLKNRFALTEKSVDGIHCWMNVRIK